MNNTITNTDLKEKCKQFMAEYELAPSEIIADGKIHRYSIDEKKSKPDEWYVAYEGISSKRNPFFMCVFGSWCDGSKYEYKSFEDSETFDSQEINELKQFLDKQRLQTDQQIKEMHDKTAANAQKLWPSYSKKQPSDEHLGYIKQKNIKLFDGIKFGTNEMGFPSMIIPLYNKQGEIRSLQFISVDNNGTTYKSFLKGGEKRGNYHTIGHIPPDENVLFVCEGYATGATVHEAINKPVVVAFDAGNLKSVIGNLNYSAASYRDL